MKKLLLFSLIFQLVCSTNFTYAQSGITGKIFDAETNDPLIGASVTVKDSTQGIVSDYDGSFVLHLPPGVYELAFHYVGYESLRLPNVKVEAGKMTETNVTLQPGGAALEEVVVISAKRIKSKTETAAVSVVRSSKGHKSKKMPPPPPPPSANIMTGNNDKAPPAGQLTAGHWRDLDNKEYWKDILAEDLDEWKNHWQMYPTAVTEIELTNRQNLPVIDAEIKLYDKKSRELLWIARTDNLGKAALWVKPFEKKDRKTEVTAEVVHNGKTYPLDLKNKAGKQEKKFKVDIPCTVTPVIDLLFAIDVSGSMGDELNFLKSELVDVIGRTEKTHPGKTVRTASVCYQSPGDPYITKVSDFTTDKKQTAAFFGLQHATGGKGGEEAVELGLQHALDLNWSENAAARFLFILLDEPPAHDEKRRTHLRRLTEAAARRGIKIVPIVGSGAKRDLEFLLRSLSIMTNGTYVFLTDHSGIGSAHLEPVTDSYEVFALNNLLVKIINEGATFESCTEIDLPEEKEPDDSKVAFTVYPNPTSQYLNVEFKNDNTTAKLYNIWGKLSAELNPGETRFTVSDHAPGTYFLEIIDGKKIQTVPVVIVRE